MEISENHRSSLMGFEGFEGLEFVSSMEVVKKIVPLSLRDGTCDSNYVIYMKQYLKMGNKET